MAGNRAIKISILANTRTFKKELRNLGDVSGINRLTSAARSLGHTLAHVAKIGTAAGSALAAAGVKAASDLEQSAGTIDDIFKEHANVVHKFASTAAKDVGLSANSYNELASIISTQLKNGGTSIDQLAGKTNNLITLGADLAAGFGGSTADAVNALSSALKGERDPIERYGVSLTQAAIDAEAASLGFRKVGGSLSVQATQAATLSLIMKQTADFHGKFSRESDTLTHKTQVLTAQMTNIAATVGSYLLPVITPIVGWISDRLQPALETLSVWASTNLAPVLTTLAATFTQWLPSIQAVAATLGNTLMGAVRAAGSFISGTLIPAISGLVGWIREHSTLMIGLAGFIAGVLAAWKTYQIVMALARTVTTAFTIAQIALNLAMSANPIGIVILAIAGLVGVLVALWNYCTPFREFWIGLWNGIKTTVANVVGWFTGIPNTIGNVMSGFAAAISQGISRAVAWFTGLPQRILGAIGNLGSLLANAGRSVIDGFINGITSVWNRVKETLATLTSWLPKWKGPADKDAIILRSAGQLVIGGFIEGLESQYSHVRRSLTGFTSKLPSMVNSDLNGSLSLTAPTAAHSTPHITINVQALTPTVETGRMIAKSLDSYLAANRRGAMA